MENWITLDHFHCRKGSALVFFIGIEIFNLHLFPLPKMLLQNLPSVNFQMPLFTVMVTHAALLLTWELNLQEVKYEIGSCLWNLLILSCYHWDTDDLIWSFFEWLFSIVSYSTSWVAPLCRFKLCPVGYSIRSESVIDSLIQYGVVSSKVRIPRSMNEILEMGITFLSVTLSNLLAFFFLLLSL